MTTQPNRMKHITLSYPHATETEGVLYRVESVTNSIEYPPGLFMNDNDVAKLCNDESWHVFIGLPEDYDKPVYAVDRALGGWRK